MFKIQSKNTDTKSADGFKITGNWVEQSKLLQGKFPQLTDADLKFDVGKEDELLSRIEKKLNKKREEVVNIINKGVTQIAKN